VVARTMTDGELPSIEEAEGPVLAALREVGVEVEHVGDLVNRRDIDYRDAIPVLIEQMGLVSHPLLREWLIRALTVRSARPAAARPLLDEFRKEPDDYLRWVIGNALNTVADESVGAELIEIAGDKTYGQSRQMIVQALGRVGGPAAFDLLISLLDDPDVVAHAIYALGTRRDERARDSLEPFLTTGTTLQRREARRAIRLIDRA
jgi:HEAT repeats